MMLLVSGATKTMKCLRGHPHLGRFVTPTSWDHPRVVSGWSWAADNGAFRGFNEAAFCTMLDRLYHAPGCLFVTTPDVVGNAQATDVLFRIWGKRLREQGWPVAYVAQDGASIGTIPWPEFDTLFIGGSTAYKLAARPLVRAAKAHGKHVHIGRVNTLRRLRWAYLAGADTVDGTAFSRFPDRYVPWALSFLVRLHAQPTLALFPDSDGCQRLEGNQ